MNDVIAPPETEKGKPKLRPPAPRPRSRLRLFLGLAAVLAVAIGVGWWIHTRPAAQAPRGRFAMNGPMPVVEAAAVKGDIDVLLNELGTVTPLATVTVKTQINGQLMHLDFQEGQLVNKGDPLAEIDSRPYELALAQAQGQLVKDQAQLTDANLDLARYRTLVKQDSIAKQTLDTQSALVGQLEGAVKTDQAQIDTAKLNIVYCHITAPVTGRVGLRQVDQGNYVQLSDANGIVVITEMQPISVIFTVPEDNLPAILKRLRSGAKLQAVAYDRSQTVKLATGVLSNVDNQIDTTTGTLKMRADFANDPENLYPNQFVNIQLLVDTLHDTTVIPSAAVQRGAPGTFVYMINADDTVAVKPIKLGPTQGERVAVSSGISPGDRVVVDGADKLRDGAKVSLRQESGAKAAAPAAAAGTATQAPVGSAAAPAPAGSAATPPAAAAGAAKAPATPAGGDQQQPGRRHKHTNAP